MAKSKTDGKNVLSELGQSLLCWLNDILILYVFSIVWFCLGNLTYAILAGIGCLALDLHILIKMIGKDKILDFLNEKSDDNKINAIVECVPNFIYAKMLLIVIMHYCFNMHF